MNNRITFFDTTLRDGEQAPGYSMNIEEKLRMARQLEALGVDVLEAGFAIASPGDFESVRRIAEALKTTTVASLCRALEKDIDAAAAAKGAARPRIHTFLATSDLYLQYKLRMTRGLRRRGGSCCDLVTLWDHPGLAMTDWPTTNL